MKKLVLILVCAVIMTVFIAFNYLLLDRERTTKSLENLKNNNESKSASIEVLGNDIKNSKEKINELNKTISKMEDNYFELAKINSELRLSINETNRLINEKNELIDKIKKDINLKPFEVILKKWCENISSGQYEASYELYSKTENGDEMSLVSFSEDMKNSIKSIKLSGIKLEDKSSNGETSGEIVFRATFETKLLKAPNFYKYSDGANEKYITFKYNKEADEWYISAMASVLS